MFLRIIFCITGILIIGLIQACNGTPNYPTGGPYYYGSFAGYSYVLRPVEKITLEETKKRDAYYVVYFSDNNKVISYTKYLYGKMEGGAKYFYDLDGLLEKRESANSKGEIKISYFDKSGNIIEPK